MSNQAGGIAIGIALATTLVSGTVAAPAAAADRLHARIVNALSDEGEDWRASASSRRSWPTASGEACSISNRAEMNGIQCITMLAR